MTEQPYETEPRTPNVITERIVEVDDKAHNDETDHINIHNMRWENIKPIFSNQKSSQS